MSHEVETMAYSGEVPWHGLGKSVSNDLTPEEMLREAGLDWRVKKVPAFAMVGGSNVAVGRCALVRESDDHILDIVSDDWNVLQNDKAFQFFVDFVTNGNMEMHTAGSLKNGSFVWALAKVKDSFDLFKGDRVDSYLLLTNPHKYGWSIDVRFTPIRVVCNNTLTLSLNSQSKNFVKVSHRQEFNADEVKEMLGIAKEKLAKYKEMAAYLGSKRYNDLSLTTYFKEVFPVTGVDDEHKAKRQISRGASRALDVIGNQPGSKFAEGSWWQAFNAVTYIMDHLHGRNQDNRMASSWYGHGRKVKQDALESAIKFAEAA